LYQFAIPPAMEECFSFSTSFPICVLIIAILIGVRWNQGCLICISLITKNFEHFLRYFSVIRDSLVVKSWFSSISHFLIELFGVLETSFLSSLYIWKPWRPAEKNGNRQLWEIVWGTLQNIPDTSHNG
jgi:hypothetical protein